MVKLPLTHNNPTRNQSKTVTMTQIFNYPFLKVNQIILLNSSEATKKDDYVTLKSHIRHNKSHHTSNNNHYISINHNSSLHSDKYTCASRITLTTRLTKLLDKHTHLKTQNQNLKIFRTP